MASSRPPASQVSISEAILTCPQAQGLAIIISNDYKGTKLRQLSGTHQDLERMQSAFMKLQYAVVSRQNMSKSRLTSLLIEASRLAQYPPTYRRIVVVFAGHGTYDDQLVMHDCNHVKLDDIVNMFLPKQAQHLASIPKLFFIDACRGEKEDPGYTCPMRSTTIPRGGKLLTTSRLPSEGNYLLAYSTMYGYKSYEMTGKGGVWMTLLSEKLVTVNKSVLDVLTDVNKDLIDLYQDERCIQQPELHSSLNEEINFFKEATEMREDVICLLSDPTFADIGEHSRVDILSGKAIRSIKKERTLSQEPLCSRKVISAIDSKAPLPSQDNVCRTKARSQSSPYQGIPRTIGTSKTAKAQLLEYCSTHSKPPPKFEQVDCEKGKYVSKVYVAKTIGWVEGEQCTSRELAEESAATILMSRLQV